MYLSIKPGLKKIGLTQLKKFPCELVNVEVAFGFLNAREKNHEKKAGTEHLARIVLALLLMPCFIAHIIFRRSKVFLWVFCDFLEFDWRVNKIRTCALNQSIGNNGRTIFAKCSVPGKKRKRVRARRPETPRNLT